MRIFGIILIFCCFKSFAFSQSFTSSNQQWIHYYSQIDFNQKNRFGFDAGFRWKNEFSEPSQYIVRISYSRKLKSNFFIGTGLAHSGYFVNGIINSQELRPYQELLFLKKINQANTQIRYRLEERFYADYVDIELSEYRFVLRNRLAFSYTFFLVKPFRKHENTTLLFFIGDEIFVNLKTRNDILWFDQNRIMFGPILKFNQKFSMQFLYNFQFAPTAYETTFKTTNVYWLSFRHSLDFSGKETTE